MLNILLIDPDEYFHAKFKEKFFDLGNLRICDKVQDLHEVFRDFQPNIIVTELLLTDGTAFELLEELQPQLQNQQFSVIIFTSISNLEDVLAAMESGVSHYLVKGQDTLEDLKHLILTNFSHVQESRT